MLGQKKKDFWKRSKKGLVSWKESWAGEKQTRPCPFQKKKLGLRTQSCYSSLWYLRPWYVKQCSLALSEWSLIGLSEARAVLHPPRWSALVFGTKEGCVGEPPMAGVSCPFHNASHHREGGSDSANWLRKREVPGRVLCNNRRSVFISDQDSWVEDWKLFQWGRLVAKGYWVDFSSQGMNWFCPSILPQELRNWNWALFVFWKTGNRAMRISLHHRCVVYNLWWTNFPGLPSLHFPSTVFPINSWEKLTRWNYAPTMS